MVAKPKALPLSDPQDIYLQMEIVICKKINPEMNTGTYHITKPVNPPKNVLRRRDASPNVVSPRKRARVSWPINLYRRANP